MSDPTQHSLLRRQLRKHFGQSFVVPDKWRAFVDAVNAAYHEFDSDREMLERSLELSSTELMQANSRMRTVLRALPDRFLWLQRDGTISRTLSLDGSDPHSLSRGLVGRKLQDLLEGQMRKKVHEAVVEAASRREIVSVDYCLDSSCRATHYEARLIPVGEEEILAVVRDVTHLRRAEEERIKTSKLDSLGLLAGGIAHDFNNLLAGIIANVSLVRTFHAHAGEAEEILGEAEQACYRAKDLTMQLLTFSKGGAPIRTTASISKLAGKVATFALRGSNVRCDFELEEDLLPVHMDVGQIGQVINNLVINSDQAMPNGGVVIIRGRNVPVSDERCFPLLDRRYVEISVSDTGAGIPDEYLGRVFDPYFSTKAGGSGLGLATCYSIIQRHDGIISVESKEEQGTTISFCLPAAESKPPISTIPPAALATGVGRILVMDDDDQILKAAGRILKKLGFDPDFARHGEEALRMCRKSVDEGDPYLLAILDLTIPGGMGGKETAKELRHISPETMSIASSGYSNDAAIAQYRDAGFNDILPKPYGLAELNELLKRLKI